MYSIRKRILKRSRLEVGEKLLMGKCREAEHMFLCEVGSRGRRGYCNNLI